MNKKQTKEVRTKLITIVGEGLEKEGFKSVYVNILKEDKFRAIYYSSGELIMEVSISVKW